MSRRSWRQSKRGKAPNRKSKRCRTLQLAHLSSSTHCSFSEFLWLLRKQRQAWKVNCAFISSLYIFLRKTLPRLPALHEPLTADYQLRQSKGDDNGFIHDWQRGVHSRESTFSQFRCCSTSSVGRQVSRGKSSLIDMLIPTHDLAITGNC